jgi:hypothetical protein
LREAYERVSPPAKAGFELGVKKAEVLFSGLSGILDELSDFKTSLYGPCSTRWSDFRWP